MLARNHVQRRLIAEKLLSHSADVTGRVHPIFSMMNKFGNFAFLWLQLAKMAFPSNYTSFTAGALT